MPSGQQLANQVLLSHLHHCNIAVLIKTVGGRWSISLPFAALLDA